MKGETMDDRKRIAREQLRALKTERARERKRERMRQRMWEIVAILAFFALATITGTMEIRWMDERNETRWEDTR